MEHSSSSGENGWLLFTTLLADTRSNFVFGKSLGGTLDYSYSKKESSCGFYQNLVSNFASSGVLMVSIVSSVHSSDMEQFLSLESVCGKMEMNTGPPPSAKQLTRSLAAHNKLSILTIQCWKLVVYMLRTRWSGVNKKTPVQNSTVSLMVNLTFRVAK